MRDLAQLLYDNQFIDDEVTVAFLRENRDFLVQWMIQERLLPEGFAVVDGKEHHGVTCRDWPRYCNDLHALTYVDPLQPILDRIPKEFGRSVDVAAGWHDIIIALDRDLAELDPDYKVNQVKEKFGGLRYYITPSFKISEDRPRFDRMQTRIAEAEAVAWHTCEETGEPGVRMRKKGVEYGWIRTLNPERFAEEWEPVPRTPFQDDPASDQ